MMKIKPLKTDTDHAEAIRRIEALMDAVPGSAESEELDVLATLVHAYEVSHFPMEAPDPIEAIKFRLEQLGLTRRELEPLLGGRSRVAEVKSRKRSLSIRQIRNLHDRLQIPYENLIGSAH